LLARLNVRIFKIEEKDGLAPRQVHQARRDLKKRVENSSTECGAGMATEMSRVSWIQDIVLRKHRCGATSGATRFPILIYDAASHLRRKANGMIFRSIG